MPPFSPPDLTDPAARRQARGALVVLAAAFLLIVLPDGAQRGLAAGLRASVLRPFLAMQEALVNGRLRSVEVERLQEALDSAHLALFARTTLEEENRELRHLLVLSERLGAEYVAAAVVRPGTRGSESLFLLDVGQDVGVAPLAPVITRAGLAGVVREVHGSSAIGMDWTHPEFRASAMTVDGLAYGFVESVSGEFRESDRLVLSDTPFSTDVPAGSLVVTSGLGGIFPRGVPIGRVTELAEAEGGWRKSYWLEPFVPAASLAHVLVATGPAEARSDDLAPAYPVDEIVSRQERVERDRQRADSLAALTQEVERLRARLDSLRRPPPSSPPAGSDPEGGAS